jgi:hypothetical protein
LTQFAKLANALIAAEEILRLSLVVVL